MQHQKLEKAVRLQLLPLFLYRSALNHRAVHTTWNQADVERSAHKLAQQITVSN